jgi:hypothetical protein
VLAEADLIKSKSRIAGAGVGDGLWNCQDAAAAAAARIREKSYACHSLGRVPQQNEFRISATERDGKVHSENKFRISLRHEDARGVQTLCKKKKKKNLKRKRWFQVKDDRSQPHNRVIIGQTHAFEWTIAPMDGRTDGWMHDRSFCGLSLHPTINS